MQISVKTPSQLTQSILEKCAVLNYPSPSFFAGDCTWQCIKWMDTPHSEFRPLYNVDKYYYSVGRENEILPPRKEAAFLQQLSIKSRKDRAQKVAKQLKEFHAKVKKNILSKPLHLKISDGGMELTDKIKEKIPWLRLSPNAFVVACLRDCLEAMEDPKKAVVPPPTVINFWIASNAHLRPKASGAIEAIILHSQEKRLREHSIPILDTIVRLALQKQWNATLKQILLESNILPKTTVSKRGEK